MVRIVLGVSLAMFLVGAVGCSSLAIPMVASRRLNDRGATYRTSPSQAETAVKAVVQEMGGEVRWVQRGPERRANVYHSVADSMSVHGTWGKLQDNSLTETNFIVDINTVAGKPDQMMIRIGSGDFGNSKIADDFQRRLAQRLPLVSAPVTASAATPSSPGEFYIVRDMEGNIVRKVMVGGGTVIQPAASDAQDAQVVKTEEILVLKPESIRYVSDNAPILRTVDATPSDEKVSGSESITDGVEVILTEQEAIERGLIPDPAKN